MAAPKTTTHPTSPESESRLVSATTTHELETMAQLGRAAMLLVHDFNNLLYSAGCVADVLLLETDSESPARADLLELKGLVRRGATLTRQLENLSRTQSGPEETVDLPKLTEELAPILRRLLGPGRDLLLRAGSGPLLAQIPRSLVEQILLQATLDLDRGQAPLGATEPALVVAIDHAEPDEPIDLGAPAAMIRLSLEGAFSSKPEQSPTWERLLDQVREYGGQGTLAATVSLLVPAACPVHAVEHSTPDGSPSSDKLRRGTVLLVDDETMARDIMARILRRYGYHIHEAATVEEALRILHDLGGTFDCLIADVMLPDGDASLLERSLLPSLSAQRIVYVSGLSSDALERQGIRLRGRRLLQKPFSPEMLLEALEGRTDAPR
jgi:two-component system, cell cycle sensor histidine kinase and response regulator CckA